MWLKAVSWRAGGVVSDGFAACGRLGAGVRGMCVYPEGPCEIVHAW